MKQIQELVDTAKDTRAVVCDDTVLWKQKGLIWETCDQLFIINCQTVKGLICEAVKRLIASRMRISVIHFIICYNPTYSFDLHHRSTSNTYGGLFIYDEERTKAAQKGTRQLQYNIITTCIVQQKRNILEY